MWEDDLKEGAIGSGAERVVLDILSCEDSAGRALVEHKYPHRDGADTEDMGAEARTTSLRLCFFPHAKRPDPYGDFLRLVKLKDQGKPQKFTHPLTGTYDARVREFSFTVDPAQRDTIMVTMTVIEHSTVRAVFEAAEGSPLLSGVEEVTAASANLSAALEAEELESTVGDECVEEVSTWAEDDLGVRDINLSVVALSNRISEETDRLDLATDIKRWPVLKAMHHLHHNVVRAAAVITARSPRFVEIRVDMTAPLLVIAARYYGASEAGDRAEQLSKLNVVRNPARVEAGTILKAQAKTAPARVRTPA